ncbi:hypothetical protein RD792_011800 [Penstemon davidsonii]|uniref:Sodium/calcium exchanger membrane region domain-containing protein n=1 Tax=Penstemon davidsonii TaxID=160366 RepID=A0ABR0CV47_9LAMI|nr:hypothetical protein RD792_011800 [Penstemon davidsonii]
MLIAYVAYLVFQLWTHRQLFEAEEGEEEDGDVVSDDESAVIGFWSAFVWLVLMTGVVALLSEYVVATIETASDTWGLSVSFISVILLPIVGNAAEHAGAIIFAFKNKYDISLGVALGSATQIAMFVVPLCVIVSWIIGINMDLNFGILETSSLAISILVTAFTLQTASDTWGLSVSFISVILLPIVGNAAEHAGAIIFAFKNKYDISLGVALGSATQIAMFVVPLCVIVSWIIGINMDLNFGILETSSLAISILVTAFTLQDGTSHYLKGLVLLLCYLIIGACFFVFRAPLNSAT